MKPQEKFAAHLKREKQRAVDRAAAAAMSVREEIESTWRDLVAMLTANSAPSESRIASVSRRITAGAKVVIGRSLAGAADESWSASVDGWLRSVPRGYWQWILAKRGQSLAEAVIDLRLPTSTEAAGIRKLLFKPPSAKRVERIISGADDGKTWDDRLRRWSRFVEPDKIRSRISRAVSQGRTAREIAQDIQPLVGNYASSAERVARTEVHRVHNRIVEESFGRVDELIEGLEISEILDDVTEPSHAERDGRVYYKDRHPRIATMPRPPDRANCRGWTSPIFVGEDEIEQDLQREEVEKKKVEKKKTAKKKVSPELIPSTSPVENLNIGTITHGELADAAKWSYANRDRRDSLKAELRRQIQLEVDRQVAAGLSRFQASDMATDEGFVKLTIGDQEWLFPPDGAGQVADSLILINDSGSGIFNRRTIPRSVHEATKRIVLTTQSNKNDSHWEKAYRMPGFRSSAAGGNGTIVKFRFPERVTRDLYIHETGHNFGRSEWRSASPARNSEYWRAAQVEGPVTEYGALSPAEDFAEATMLFFDSPARFQRDFPLKTKALENLFGVDPWKP